MSSATLTSLAMLKVNIDQGRDYLDYLRPFILQVLCDHKPNPITDATVRDHIRNDFGLEIPERTVQLVLKRLSRQYPLTRAHGVYSITGELPDPGISTKKAEANRHIQSIVNGLKEFSKNTIKPVTSDENAVEAICQFLSEFNIPCLRAYLRGTAIPDIKKHDNTLVVLLSKYLLQIQAADLERFESFMVLVKGHMLANALLCPDLHQAPKTYNGVTFYFDTPLLVRRIGLEGYEKQAATKDLIELLRKLGATVAAFSHSRDELERVIQGASDYVDSPDGRGEIVMQARRTDATKSDLLIIAGQIDDKLKSAKIQVLPTPQYISAYQIGEKAFENVLKDEVWYNNPRAREDDVNSVRSIYVLRSGSSPSSVERAKAVLVTSNSGFAQAAFAYGKDHEETREVSSVITDFSLANMAWLKAPMGAPNLPMTEVVAFSYAALQPKNGFLDKALQEIDKLGKQGAISERDHQVLRSSDLAQKELMNLTLGQEDALTAETVTATLSRVTSEIKKEENEKYQSEQAAHQQTQRELAAARADKKDIQSRIFWRCRRKASICAGIISSIISLLIIAGLLAGIGLTTKNPVVGWILVVGAGVLIVATIGNLFCGTTVAGLHNWAQSHILTWFLKREAAATGLDFEGVQ